MLFNLFGYRILFYYAQQHSDEQLKASFDKEVYDESDLITIKVPLSLPYQRAWTDYERVDGEIKVNGTIYKYVKRKVEDGQLVLLCLPDHNKMRLESAKGDFYKNVNDLAPNAGPKKTEKVKSFSDTQSEYVVAPLPDMAAALQLRHHYGLPGNELTLITAPHCSPEQPPEVL